MFATSASLKHAAMIRIGQQIWQRPEIGKLIENLFYMDNRQDNNSKRNEWNIFTSEILKNLKETNVPENLMRDLLHVVKGMGEEIFDWHNYVATLNICYYETYQCELDYPDKHVWTTLGTLDARKMIEVNWFDNTNQWNISAIFNIACRLGVDQDKVSRLWEVEGLYPSMGDATSLYYSKPMNLAFLQDIFGDAMKTSLFTESVGYGNSGLVQTVWKKLDDSEKIDLVFKGFQKALKIYKNCKKPFEKKKYAEIILFLFGEMSKQQKVQITEESAVEVMKIFSNYPWHSFFDVTVMEMRKLKIVKNDLLDKVVQQHHANLEDILQ